jgi:hypothetical protein
VCGIPLTLPEPIGHQIRGFVFYVTIHVRSKNKLLTVIWLSDMVILLPNEIRFVDVLVGPRMSVAVDLVRRVFDSEPLCQRNELSEKESFFVFQPPRRFPFFARSIQIRSVRSSEIRFDSTKANEIAFPVSFELRISNRELVVCNFEGP